MELTTSTTNAFGISKSLIYIAVGVYICDTPQRELTYPFIIKKSQIHLVPGSSNYISTLSTSTLGMLTLATIYPFNLY
ncbi:hypothetical protein K0040_06755 [Terrisporobacter petrolearius]|uniref:hypothetical protein n=1 Tax=Terrisporobacter petrolearius TaxID=1460447 RepID=UPI001D1613BA|nr:hypothetical protein [Terrisporobacter petrolearius]MCC3864012.1 hypothetical protein [Terrisporobacter petrolearius]